MKNLMGRLFRRSAFSVGEGMRGRVHKISIISGGEVSIVVRFGLDEPRARQLLQGSLVELFETREGIPPREFVKGEPGKITILEPHQGPAPPPSSPPPIPGDTQ